MLISLGNPLAMELLVVTFSCCWSLLVTATVSADQNHDAVAKSVCLWKRAHELLKLQVRRFEQINQSAKETFSNEDSGSGLELLGQIFLTTTF